MNTITVDLKLSLPSAILIKCTTAAWFFSLSQGLLLPRAKLKHDLNLPAYVLPSSMQVFYGELWWVKVQFTLLLQTAVKSFHLTPLLSHRQRGQASTTSKTGKGCLRLAAPTAHTQYTAVLLKAAERKAKELGYCTVRKLAQDCIKVTGNLLGWKYSNTIKKQEGKKQPATPPHSLQEEMHMCWV